MARQPSLNYFFERLFLCFTGLLNPRKNNNYENIEADAENSYSASDKDKLIADSKASFEVNSSNQAQDGENPAFQSNIPENRFDNQRLSADLDLRYVGDKPFGIRRFQIPKQGLSEAECEDKSALSSSSETSLRVAVADGATESLFSDIWAEILVNSYVEKSAEIFNASVLESVQQEFVNKASQLILKMPETRHWFMYEKLDRGSHVTFAAVEFSNPETIQVLAVGDSCVFWRSGHNSNLVEMLPELAPEAFGAFPASICHLPKTWQNLKSKIIKKEVHLQDTFELLICTDALACWLAQELQNDSSVWEKLFQITDSISFTNFIENLRYRKEIRNDDVTLVLIHAIPVNDRLP